MSRYIVNKYSGRTYCGNAFYDTFIECMQFGDDGICDRIVINNTEENRKYTVKITEIINKENTDEQT